MTTANHKRQTLSAQDNEHVLPPIVGRLTWIGSNLGIDVPIFLCAEDEAGREHMLGLAEALEKIDRFDGYRGNRPVKENIIDCAFIAYESGLMTEAERKAFGEFVRTRLNDTVPFDPEKAAMGFARKALLRQ